MVLRGWLEGCAILPPTLLVISASSSSWRFTFYLIAFIAGMAVIVDVSGDYWQVEWALLEDGGRFSGKVG